MTERAAYVSAVAWIGVDWGTTRMRAYAFDAAGRMTHAATGPGMNALRSEDFEQALLDTVDEWLGDGTRAGTLPAVICGMAGSRQGWIEAPYLDVPAALAHVPLGAVRAPARDGRIEVRILPGLCRRDEEHPDVLRGEETQLLGLSSRRPGFRGMACLPGTHSKWARVEDGRILAFSTYMTGELFALLAGQSVLRHSVDPDTGEDEAAFSSAVRTAFHEPRRLSAELFGLRARDLLFGATGAEGAAALSGLLIGAELSAALAEVAEDADIALVGAPALTARYAAALAACGRRAETIDGDDAVRAGLVTARTALAGRAAEAA